MKNVSMKKLSYYFICAFLLLGYSMQAQISVSGKVIGPDSEPVIGANIFLDGSSLGTISDIDGTYQINVPSEGGTLVFSYLGYSTKRLNVDSGSSNLSFDAVLGEDALAFDEVIVTGSFTGRTQKEAPMSLTLIDNKNLQRLSSNSQADVLRTVPGITAEGGGGEVATNLFVRGFPSGGQYAFTPLQIDGIPVLSTFGLNSSAHDVYFRNDIGLQNLEFVRGGSSTLMGAGSVAGIVNYNSVRGTATPDNKVQLEWGENGRVRTDFLSSGPLADDLYYAFSGF